jgi:phenylacetate-CoA ligase
MYLHDAETLSRDQLETLQTDRLKQVVARAMQSPCYQEQLCQLDVGPEDITSCRDIGKLPLTTKEELRSHYPWGMVAVPREELVRLHVSSGTTGTPTVVYHTQSDLDEWADLVARCMHMVGMRANDVFQNMSGYGLFTGGLGMHYGAERLGCLTVPAGAGNTLRQIKLIQDFSTTCVHIIPSYALYFGTKLAEQGIDPASLGLRIALIGAEPHTDEARSRIEELLHVKAYNSYGLSEMNGPGVAFECTEQDGMHIWEDAFLVEIVDPVTFEPVEDGKPGELVMTTLTRTGMPIIRYRTKDLTRIVPGECPCGRTHRRIDRIKGRSDDMLIIKGVNFYPMQIEQVLMAIPEVGQNYLIVLERDGYMDNVRIKVEIKDEHFVEDMRELKGLQQRITRKLRDEILFTPRVDLVQHQSLPKAEGKAVRVMDERDRGAN